MQFDLDFLKQLIIDSARAEILPRYQQIESSTKADGTLVTEADLGVQHRIQQGLSERYPTIPFLGEEMSTEAQQALLDNSAEGLWCLDPLDGTSNFVAGMPCFGVSLAYVQDGETRLGIIYDPIREECFSAVKGEGAWLNGKRLLLNDETASLSDCIAMVDMKRLAPPLACNLVTKAPYRSQRSIGSVALEWCWLAAGRAQLYLHGGQRIWDFGAGRLIFAEAGGSFTLTDGMAQGSGYTLDLNQKVAKAALNPTLLTQWEVWIEQSSRG